MDNAKEKQDWQEALKAHGFNTKWELLDLFKVRSERLEGLQRAYTGLFRAARAVVRVAEAEPSIDPEYTCILELRAQVENLGGVWEQNNVTE